MSVQSEVEHELDLSVIRYSRVEEDHRVLSKGLNIKAEEDVVLSITSSGDNVLNLLLERPKRIVALDFSPAQNAILELKIAAIAHLEYQEYLELLGEAESYNEKRMMLYQKIEEYLPEYSQKYWRTHTSNLKEGLSDCGRFQKYIREQIAEKVKKLVPPTLLERFLGAKDLKEQRTQFEQFPLNKIQEIIKGAVVNQVSGRSEAQMKYTTLTVDEMVDRVWKHFCAVCQDIPIGDNYYHCQYIGGSKSRVEPLPPYLTKHGFDDLKGLIGRIDVITGSIENYFCSTSTKIDKMNLSDVFEYMSVKSSVDLFTLLSKKMAPGGRMAFWMLFNDRLPPVENLKLSVLKDLSQELHKDDRVFFYKSFCVVEVV